jgi:hypothetical protein
MDPAGSGVYLAIFEAIKKNMLSNSHQLFNFKYKTMNIFRKFLLVLDKKK